MRDAAQQAFVDGLGDALTVGVVATALGALAAAAILPGRQRDPEKKASARVYPERTSTDLIK